MLRNRLYSQKLVSVEIPINLGKYVLKGNEKEDYRILLLETAFMQKSITGYEFVPHGEDTIILRGKGPHTKGRLLQVIKQTILEDIKSEKSPLRTSFETPYFCTRCD